MRRKQTLRTVLRLTDVTDHESIGRGVYDTLARLLRAELFVGVFDCLVELVHSAVLLLDVQGQLLEEIPLSVHSDLALLLGTVHLLEIVDLVDNVVVQAGLTKVSVLTLAQRTNLFVDFELSLAYLAVDDAKVAADLLSNSTGDLSMHFGRRLFDSGFFQFWR